MSIRYVFITSISCLSESSSESIWKSDSYAPITFSFFILAPCLGFLARWCLPRFVTSKFFA